MSADEKAYLLYLLLLLLFIGSGYLATRGERLSTTLRNALLWVIIFGGVVALYGLSDRLQQQLLPGRALSTGEAYEVVRARDGSFHLVLEVNGVPVSFLVDTGASQIVLSRDDARRIGLDPDRLAYTGRAETANGTVATAPVVLESVRLGDHVWHDVRASVNAGEMPHSLLGMSFLNRLGEVTLRGDRLILRP